MPRIAQKEINVNIQMKQQMEKSSEESSFEAEPITFDPGWGPVCIDPVTGKIARLYDHVQRNIKFSGGIQIWIYVPRYLLDGGGMFRVLPANLCVNKHYVVEEIQDVVDNAIKELTQSESEKPSRKEQIQRQLNGDDDEPERPCERTKWLWILWFFKNLLLIESTLRLLQLIYADTTGSGKSKYFEFLTQTDYLSELRLQEPEDWLKIVIQSSWNSGRPLIPLRDCQTMKKVLEWLTVTPDSTN